MCATCGCGDDASVRITTVGSPGRHDHDHDHDRDHAHDQDHDGQTVLLEQRVLAKNDRYAAQNRAWLTQRGVCVVNLMSAPGAGKTTLLERTIRDVGDELRLSVIEGDQETLLDGERIRATGCPVVQINTGAGCHLDAEMMANGLRELDPALDSLVVVENVGNLVCPASFDLGESYRVVITAVTEGPDKPLKYPQMFRGADLVVLTKADLLPYLDVDVAQITAGVRLVNPRASVLTLSATNGDGTAEWYGRLRELRTRPHHIMS